MKGLFVILTVLIFFIMAISWISFARLSMARIERQMQQDGLSKQATWDGIGLRVLWFASAIAFPVGLFNQIDDPLIDVPTVRRYATSRDRVLGWVLMVSGLLFLVVVLVGGVFLDLE